MLSYNDFRDELQTGDVVLFGGKGPVSNVIKWASRSLWSHVGMFYRMNSDSRVMIAESTTLSDIDDVTTGTRIEGVSIVPASIRLARYDGRIAIRRINQVRSKESLERVDDWMRVIHQRPYERSTWQLIKAQYDGPFGANEEDFSSIFCSEFVAESLEIMGFVSGKKPANEFTPHNFSCNDSSDDSVKLIDGATWSKQSTIKLG